MAKFGAFGGIGFECSSFRILTYDNYKRTTRHRYAAHEVVNSKPRLESLGGDLTEIEMEITLARELGVAVDYELSVLQEMCTQGVVDYLILGVEVVGLFVLEEMTETVKRWDGAGRPVHVTAQLKFKEYV